MASSLLIALSSHGFGHIGQTAPVVRALLEQAPDLDVTLLCAAPRAKLRERFGAAVRIDEVRHDFGMIQADALRLKLDDSADAYADFHRDWDDRVAAEARRLEAYAPDLLLANVPYLPLAAAELAGIPAVGYCSINWAEIYGHLLRGRRPEGPALHAQMLQAYASAIEFLRPEPAMPFAGLTNVRSIGPIAELAPVTRRQVRDALGAGEDERLVMVSLGGMSLVLSPQRWPQRPGIRYVVPAEWGVQRPDMLALEALELPYTHVLRGCDALVAKPGYGSFVEAAALAIPVLYLDRPGWPEVPYLVSWLQRHGRCAHLPEAAFADGAVPAALEALWETTAPSPPAMTGIDEAAAALLRHLRGGDTPTPPRD